MEVMAMTQLKTQRTTGPKRKCRGAERRVSMLGPSRSDAGSQIIVTFKKSAKIIHFYF